MSGRAAARQDRAPWGASIIKTVMVLWLVSGAVAVPLQGQPRSYGVTVTAEKGVDFSKFKTYAWTAGRPSFVKTIDAQIVAAVDRELSGLGISKVESGADVLVTYTSLTRTDVDLKGKSGADSSPREYSVGMLAVALLEPASRRQLLQLRIDQPIDTEPTSLEAAINSAVTELFLKYPTRTRK